MLPCTKIPSSLNLLAVRNWVSSVSPTLLSCIILSHLRIFTRILFAILCNIIQYFFLTVCSFPNPGCRGISGPP